MNISALLLLALCLVQQTFGQTKTVCNKDNCRGTRTNPIPRGQQWLKVGVASQFRGCCAFKKGGCDYCAQQTYECYNDDTNWEWTDASQQCYGLQWDSTATTQQACKENCANDKSCKVWQLMGGPSCWRGKSNDCNGNDKVTAGGRKETDDSWCKQQGAPYVYQSEGDKSKSNYPGCGKCSCCRALNPSYNGYQYQNSQNDEWCQTVGFPYVWAGPTTGHWHKLCGYYACCEMYANPQVATEEEWAQAIEAADEIEVAEQQYLAEAVFNVQDTSASGPGIGVTALACVGFFFLTYGAYKHYSKN